MGQHVAITAPAGWEVAVVVDSRLEGDLAVRMLAAADVEAVTVERGPVDFAVFVPDGDRDRASSILDVR
jgi:hypothetical protein